MRMEPVRKYLRNLLVLGLVLGLLAGRVLPVQAHAILVSSDPPDNAVLPAAPPAIRLTFSEGISAQFSVFQVADQNNQPVAFTSLRFDAASPGQVIIDLPPLADGVYTVKYRVLSTVDGHFGSGMIAFGVGADAQVTGAGGSRAGVRISAWEVLGRALNYGGILAAVGVVSLLLFTLAPGALPAGVSPNVQALQAGARQRVLRFGRWATGMAFFAGFLLLFEQGAALVQVLPAGSSILAGIRDLLSHTDWGVFWIARQVLLAVLFSLLCMPGGEPRLAGYVALCVLAAQSLTSHAAAVLPAPTLPILANWVHLGAVALWAGGLAGLAAGLLPLLLRQKQDFLVLTRALWSPYSRAAGLGVALMLASGLFATGQQVISPDALLLTAYGRTLLAKIGLALVMLALGLANARILHPGLLLSRPKPSSGRAFPYLVGFEAGLALAVVALAAFLTANPVATGAELAMTPGEIPDSLSLNASDLIVTLSGKPNKPGTNIFTVRLFNTRRPPPAEFSGVSLAFSRAESNASPVILALEPAEKDVFRAAGSPFTAPGRWQVAVQIRRAGMPDVEARFEWQVAPPVDPPPLLLSRWRWQPALTLAGAALALLAVLGGLVWLVKKAG